MNRPMTLCGQCGAETERVWLTKASAVIGDDIPGGVWIRHGLCDPDTGEPRKYYSKSEMKREAERRGLVNKVEHRGTRGGDRSNFTNRWI